MASKFKAAIYARVSTSHHDQNPEAQVLELRRYCNARDWEITEVVIDHGYSGATDVRPGLRKLMGMVRARQVDAVVVVKLDRLFRSLKNLVTTLEEFSALGVTFVATKDHVDYTTPTGRLFVQILGSLAEFEKSLLRERTLMGLELARSKGKRLGRPVAHDNALIRQLRGQGLSYRAIKAQTGASLGSINRALGVPKTPPESDRAGSKKTRS